MGTIFTIWESLWYEAHYCNMKTIITWEPIISRHQCYYNNMNTLMITKHHTVSGL